MYLSVLYTICRRSQIKDGEGMQRGVIFSGLNVGMRVISFEGLHTGRQRLLGVGLACFHHIPLGPVYHHGWTCWAHISHRSMQPLSDVLLKTHMHTTKTKTQSFCKKFREEGQLYLALAVKKERGRNQSMGIRNHMVKRAAVHFQSKQSSKENSGRTVL